MDIVDISAVALGECPAEVLAFSDKLADRKPRYIKPLDALAGDKINAPAFADIIGEKVERSKLKRSLALFPLFLLREK